MLMIPPDKLAEIKELREEYRKLSSDPLATDKAVMASLLKYRTAVKNADKDYWESAKRNL